MLEERKYKYKKNIYIYGIIILVIAAMIWTIYIHQRNTLIDLRSNEMISIAKISANNLKEYFEEKIDYLNNVFQIDNELLESEIDIDKYIESKIFNMKEKSNCYEGEIRYINSNLFDQYDIDGYDFEGCKIGPVTFNEEYNYSIQLIKPILINDKLKGVVLVEYLLDDIYKETLGRIQVGKYGYCTLKDKNGAILMHGDKRQIGLDSIKDRKEKYPELDPEGIERLVSNQLRGEVGSDIIKSYWWGEDEVKQVKKIIGYAPMEFGGHQWIVSAITSYDEIAIPIANTFYFIVIFGTILIILIVSFIIYIAKMKNRQEKIILELKYAEEMNKTTKMLRKHEEQLSKINSIHTLGMIASTLAHEFKNLLTPIFIYSEILINNLKNNKEAIEDLNEIIVAANNCLELSKNILSYSKEEIIENKLWFNSCEEMSNILNVLKVIMPPNIEIKEYISKDEIYLYGNRREFKQIVLNICTNAYQAMEEKGGNIDINYFIKDKKAILTIQDTGCGIEEKIMNNIFEPFYTSKANNGTGLGLSIVVELLKKINGSIKFESKEGIGTKAKIEFNNIKIDKS